MRNTQPQHNLGHPEPPSFDPVGGLLAGDPPLLEWFPIRLQTSSYNREENPGSEDTKALPQTECKQQDTQTLADILQH